MNVSELIAALTDQSIDCSARAIMPRDEYVNYIQWLNTRKNNIITDLRYHWDYVTELVCKLPIDHTPTKLLLIAYKSIPAAHAQKHIDVYHRLIELNVVLSSIIIADNNADNTILYNIQQYDDIDTMTSVDANNTAETKDAMNKFAASLGW